MKNDSGQMTVEFMLAFPVMLIVGVIAVNALLFFSECAAFDRIAREAVRIHACSPAYGQNADQSCAQIAQLLEGHFDKDYLDSSVAASSDSWGHTTYVSTLEFSPTLFGMGLRSEIFGVPLPSLTHSVSLTVDVYKSGVLI